MVILVIAQQASNYKNKKLITKPIIQKMIRC